jgi:uncharacterized repeat protein (TIGR03806 family)
MRATIKRMRSWLALLPIVLLASCGGSGDHGSDAQPYGIEQRATLAPLAFPALAPQSGDVQMQPAFPSLSFDSPLVVTAVPGASARLAVATQPGLIQMFDERDDVASATTVLDLRDRTHADGEQGLLGLAFDPAYTSNGFVYVYYSDLRAGSPGPTIVARFHSDTASGVIDRASETRLLSITQPNFTNHKGGALAFGSDGLLYIAVGDGGSANDPNNNAQNLGVLLGKILRIRSDGSIPDDNPFVASPGARGEIWSYGMRNPFRISFDANGRLWAGDVGQDQVEEIDLITRGGNYGWRIYEGTRSNVNPDNRPATDFVAPLFTYNHDVGQSIIGGRVYRGSVAALAGAYIYGDFVSGRVWALSERDGSVVGNVELGTLPNPSSFGEDRDGELLATAFDGHLYRFVATSDGADVPFPQLLSQTGLFTNTAAMTPASGLIEYSVNAPFWSDGANKRRWIALPNGAHIGFSADAAWSFPLGSVIVKYFEMPLADGSIKRLETRLLINQASGWQGYTYRWNDSGSDATLLDGSATVALTVADVSAASGSRTQTYEFPSRADCQRCHNAPAGALLGLRSAQLNGDFDYGAATDNQLRTLDHIGLFDRSIGSAAQYAALANPADIHATLSARARAYLDSDCSQCHRPNGPTPVDMDLRAYTAMADTHTLGVALDGTDLGIAGAQRIAGGDKARSLVWQRMQQLDDTRMPPLASHAVDTAGVDLIGAWIDAGAP